MTNAQDLLKRFKVLVGKKANWENIYREAMEYIIPMKEAFDEQESGLRRDRADRRFDSTATAAMQKFVSLLQSSMVPPKKKWAKLRMGEGLRKGLGVEEVKRQEEELERVTDIFFSELFVSNFDTQIAEAFEDLAIGTGALLIQPAEGKSGIRFSSVSLEQLYVEAGAEGAISSVFRKIKIPLRSIASFWPDFKIDVELKQRIEAEPEKEESFIESTVPEIIDLPVIRGRETVVEQVQGFKYRVVSEKGGGILVERDERTNPWVVFRWSLTPGEEYGRGPGLIALADIKCLNMVKQLTLQRASLDVSGAYTVVHDGVVNLDNFQASPGSLNPVAHNPGSPAGPSIASLPISGRFDVATLVINDLKEAINMAFFANPIGPVDLPVKTATEISVRQNELAARIGSSFGRLQTEFLMPLVDRSLDLLEQQGFFDLGGFRLDNRILAIDYVSPLTQAQDVEELRSLQTFKTLMTQLYGSLGVITSDPKKLILRAAELLDVPKEVLPRGQELEQLTALIKQTVISSAQPQTGQ